MITYNHVQWIGGKAYRVGTCLSSDVKPNDPKMMNGSRLFEMDSATLYTWDAAYSMWRANSNSARENTLADRLQSIAHALYNPSDTMNKLVTLDETELASATVVEALGIPVYVSDVSDYSSYGLTDTGWYIFARVAAVEGTTVDENTVITGAAGYIATSGAAYVDIAVRFGVAAESQKVTVNWGSYTDTFVFKATDLAVRNLDYRTTFYVYDLAEFVTWQYALTTDETFQEGKNYYTESDGVYTLATVTVGETIPADTYYNHNKLIISDMTRNITYRLDEVIDCPSEVILPAIEDDTHGCWFEFQLQHSGKFSMTLTPPEGVKIATEHTQAEDKGFNLIDLHYMDIGGVKMWRFMNTHSSIPTT